MEAHSYAIRSALSNFSQRLLALEELAAAVAPALTTLQERPNWSDEITEALNVLDEPRRTKAVAVMERMPKLWSAYQKRDVDAATIAVSEANSVDESIVFEVTESGFSITAADRELAHPVVLLLDGLKQSEGPSHGILLRRSLLTMAVGAVEVLVGDLYRAYLRKHPKAMGGADKLYSLDDLQAIGTVEEAIDDLIARRVDEVTRLGLDGWAKHFGPDGLQIKLGDCALSWDHIREIFERRNVIVHHNGRASKQYVHKTPASLAKDIRVGAALEVDEMYLNSSLDQMLALGLTLGGRLWARLYKRDHEDVGDWLIDRQIELIKHDRPVVACALLEVLPISQYSTEHQLILRVNAWLSRKMQSGPDAIRREVEAWDTRPLAGRYKLASAALLDRHDEASALVRQLIEQGELSRVDLRTWPMLKELRTSGKVDDLVKPLTTEVEAMPKLPEGSPD